MKKSLEQLKTEASKVYFIKLGDSGGMADTCIKEGIIYLKYAAEGSFEVYKKGDWKEARKLWYNGSDGAATRHVNQIKSFFEADESTLWITFENGCLYWCFSEPGAYKYTDSKGDYIGSYLKTLDGWHNKDIKDKELTLDRLSGTLTKTQGFRGTICNVHDHDYLVKKIKCETSQTLSDAEIAKSKLENALVLLIKKLDPKDFEIFVDIVFSRRGWQRTSAVGGTQKTVDMEYTNPFTSEKALVQVKCQTDINQLNDYVRDFQGRKQPNGNVQMFYVWHSGVVDKKNIQKIIEDEEGFHPIDEKELARWCMETGTMTWLFDKAHIIS